MPISNQGSAAGDPNNELLLGLWLDAQLNEQQQSLFEQRCLDDQGFAAQVEAANMMAMQSEQYHSQALPKWDRASTFEYDEKAPWWQWRGFASAAFASSLLAIVMVLSGMQVKMQEGEMTISFTTKQSPQDIEHLVEGRLIEFQQSQQTLLTEYAKTMQSQQLQASSQLTAYLLNSSRQERREDFAELIKFVNEQRSDDQTFYARQLNKLQKDIYAAPVTTELDSINE